MITGARASRTMGIFIFAAAVICLGYVNARLQTDSVSITPIGSSATDGSGNDTQERPLASQFKDPPAYLESLKRPMFSPSRLPFVPKPEPPPLAEVAPTPPDIAPPRAIDFKGTRMSHGRLAALLITEDGQATWFEEGQLAGEWKIEAIFADKVLVNFKDRRLTLSLYGNEGMNSNASTAAP